MNAGVKRLWGMVLTACIGTSAVVAMPGSPARAARSADLAFNTAHLSDIENPRGGYPTDYPTISALIDIGCRHQDLMARCARALVTRMMKEKFNGEAKSRLGQRTNYASIMIGLQRDKSDLFVQFFSRCPFGAHSGYLSDKECLDVVMLLDDFIGRGSVWDRPLAESVVNILDDIAQSKRGDDVCSTARTAAARIKRLASESAPGVCEVECDDDVCTPSEKDAYSVSADSESIASTPTSRSSRSSC